MEEVGLQEIGLRVAVGHLFLWAVVTTLVSVSRGPLRNLLLYLSIGLLGSIGGAVYLMIS